MKKLVMEGKLKMVEEEGGYTPPHIEIDDRPIHAAIILAATGKSVYSQEKPFFNLPNDDIVWNGGQIRLTIEFLEGTK